MRDEHPKNPPPRFRSWRRDGADRLETASAVLGALLLTQGILATHIEAVTTAAGELLGLARALRLDAVEPWPALTIGEVAHRVQSPLRALRIAARSHGATDETALEDLALVMDDLEELLREATLLAPLSTAPEASRATPRGLA